MEISQDAKCFIGLHKYEVLKEECVFNERREIVSKAIVNRCTNCGKIKVSYVYLIKAI